MQLAHVRPWHLYSSVVETAGLQRSALTVHLQKIEHGRYLLRLHRAAQLKSVHRACTERIIFASYLDVSKENDGIHK